jgi:hypothetical protein
MIVILSVVAIVLLIGVLAIFLYIIGSLLSRISQNLIDGNESVKTIISHAHQIKPGIDHINNTGGTVSGALPLLYGNAERLAEARQPTEPAAGRPRGDGPVRQDASKAASSVQRRRSRLTEMVGYRPG